MLLIEGNKKLQDHLTKIGRSKETIRSYIHHNQVFGRYLDQKNNGPTFLEDVTTENIEEYQHMLKVRKNYKPASINLSLNAIRSLYKLAIRKNWVTKNPAADVDPVRVQRKERDFLDEEEIQQVVDRIGHPIIKLIVRTLAYTGLRISECLHLTLDDVDLTNNVIHVRAGKGNKDRFVPIAQSLIPYLAEYLKDYRPNTASNSFFATEKTGAVSAVYVNRVLKETCEELGWTKHVTCHVLRHSFASLLVSKGTQIPTLASLLGHADYRTVTSIYVHTKTEQLAEAVNQL
ncbi:tyrosine-type recombinase/integrase [Brevibacillus borstelensis]|uniref:tyrosine-type recombinase/integrase n=1 Tax=Brevibacillus borstelensis TaxID=45462 RepID=UPI00203B2B55|nr:tyrosine-type recombinase/integrase [Brevibacillus borstelensis]MCM3625618.1 tyrosine-type recombinase/integrase [Brevibacillus borstelensis]